MIFTDDALDGLSGIVSEVLTTKPIKNELTYQVEYTKPDGAKDSTFFRWQEVMPARDGVAVCASCDAPLSEHDEFGDHPTNGCMSGPASYLAFADESEAEYNRRTNYGKF